MADPQNSIDAVSLGQTAAFDMSLWGMFTSSDLISKGIILALLLCSVWSWAVILEKRGALKRLKRRANKFEESFWSGEALDKLHQRVKKSPQDPMLKTFSSGMEEWQNTISSGIPDSEHIQASLKQRVERAMTVTIVREMTKLEKGMTFLASVGSTAPFIGLFGTVWGIMNSFGAIAQTQNTSLVVVAPGIAEALLTTALGLVASIPAVIAFNIFSTSMARYADRLEGFAAEFSAILSRHLDSQKSTSRKAA